MRIRNLVWVGLVAGLLLVNRAHALSASEVEEKLKLIKLPPGFSIELYAGNLEHARSLTVGDKGTVFIGTRNGKSVRAVVDTDGDFRADKEYTVFTLGDIGDGKERSMPNGVVFHEGALFIAMPSTVVRLDDIENHLEDPPKPVVVTDDFPSDGHHGWKYIAFGPDGKLYIPVGTPCDNCLPEEEIYGTISRIDADGSNREIVAHGVRNTLGFDWHPETGQLWFTENGADNMGEDLPAEEVNVVTEAGQHFGNPFVHQGDLLDPVHGAGKSLDDFERPIVKLDPHVAALGMRFYTGEMFPAAYKNQAFIAEHGSGGRKEFIGYRVMLVRTDGHSVSSYENFATGWLQDNVGWGRPVDLVTLSDGSMLLSDDRAGAVYRIRYEK